MPAKTKSKGTRSARSARGAPKPRKPGKPGKPGKPMKSAAKKRPAAARVTAKPTAKKPAAAKPRLARRAAPKRVKSDPAAVTSATVTLPLDAIGDAVATTRKPGPLARLASGVGNLFARMTGRARTGDDIESDDVPPPEDHTLEVHTADIILAQPVAEPAPRKRSKKPPPPPPRAS